MSARHQRPACGFSQDAHLQEANEQAAELALAMFREKVRRWLAKMHGYECQVGPVLLYAAELGAGGQVF